MGEPLPRALRKPSSSHTGHWRARRNFIEGTSITSTSDIKRKARAFAHSPDQIIVLPGITPFIASSQVEADRLQEEFNALIQPELSLTQLRQMTVLTSLDSTSMVPLYRI